MNIVKGEGLPDFVMLEDVSEDAFYANLRERLDKGIIYTYIGEQVVSVNPYRAMDLYGDEQMAKYKNKYIYEVQPHIYALADDTYRNLMTTKRNQCVIITGESGAGKTEASKVFMQYISAVSRSTADADRIKDRLLSSNPVLESFGNAKTLRNDNSSRFGKYMEIQFDGVGAPMGGQISQYLLEKSRVITRAVGERSFHIFYCLLTQVTLLPSLSLQPDPMQYRYLALSECTTVATVDDTKLFAEVKKAMRSLGWTDDDMDEVWRVLAAILHIGNIEYKAVSIGNGNEGVELVNDAPVHAASSLLRVPYEDFLKSLTVRTLTTGAGRTATSVAVPLSREQANFTRDALSKGLYDRLFTEVVKHINANIERKGPAEVVVGVLDIYGFEIFEHNSFEQFCINFANEKLQQLFVRLVLQQEQEEYVREGIEWKEIDYFNNTPICQLFETKPGGIFDLLDESCLLGNSTPDSLLKKLDASLAKNNHYESFGTSHNKSIHFQAFRVKHYAGNVDYLVAQFLDKNRDTFFQDLTVALQKSSTPLIGRLFPPDSAEVSKKRPETAGTQFKGAVNGLINTLAACQPHYVRCIKPNDQQRAGEVNEERVRHQIRYLNLVETVRVRRAGFVNRQLYPRCLARYKMLSPQTWPLWSGTERDGVESVCKALGFTTEDYRLGTTKIFIRAASTLSTLEEKRTAALPVVTVPLQKSWRGFIKRWHLERWYAAIHIQRMERGRQARVRAKRESAARTIGKIWRGYRQRKKYHAEKARLIAERDEMLRILRLTKAKVVIRRCFVFYACRSYFNRLLALFKDVKTDPNFGKHRAITFQPIMRKHVFLVDVVSKVHKVWWGRSKILALGQDARDIMRRKVTAYTIFHGQKQWGCARQFQGNYLSVDTNPKRAQYDRAIATLMQTNGDRKVLFADSVMKVSSKGKSMMRCLVVTEANIYKLDGANFKACKWHTPIESVQKMGLTKKGDAFLVIYGRPPMRDILINVGLHGCERASELVLVIYEAICNKTANPPSVTFADSFSFNNARTDKATGVDVNVVLEDVATGAGAEAGVVYVKSGKNTGKLKNSAAQTV